ncbi:GTPase-associated protein 1-related protein [Streptomyces sp. WI03-4A]|uniref:GTPase-associated protein 1-related protein n=1 Tax=Streptomyces sp. WI03-4A TaxID=3028706 RepID=UPI0029AACC9C|nr:GTPase-associated protein 1-related protein [Streptomyces sp. WI03-4A]MDX2595790.1 GTPase-associated protein 1-related protein [Streptomyces sp. WI03-4A]
MSLAQLHYTSAPPGPDGSGFRFTAVSPGVPQTVLREAEQLIGYEPPRDLPARPDTEELKAFPKAFSCTELSDGGRLLSRSVYTGADYSGRWGNFHTHALHLPPGTRLPDGALPITAWESPRWADATPPDGRPEPVDRFEPSGLLRRDGLVAFARSRADRLAAFFADLAALAGEADSRQIVVVERDSADVAQWIALACAVLPRERAHLLTFTTYTRRPQQARQQIVGVLPSSEPVGHDHRFRVHDCTARPGPGPVADAWADACARIWTAGRPDLFRGNSGDLGPLAVAALVTGVPLRADARAAAAHWTAAHAPTVPEETLTALIAALTEASGTGTGRPATGAGGARTGAGSAGGDAWSRRSGTAPTGTAAGASGSGTGAGGTRASDSGAGPHRTAGTPLDHEPAALAALSARLDGQVPTAVSAPLAAHVLAAAVRDRGPLPALGAGSLTPALRAELARDLAPALRQGVGDPTEPAAGRPLALLRVADLLDVDCVDALPGLAGRLARDLVSGRPADRAAGQEPEHGSAGAVSVAGAGTDPHVDGGRVVCPPAVLDAVHGHPALRTALFGALDALAAAHPPGVAGRLAGCGLPVPPSPGFPHLRMCLQTAGAGRTGDRRARFHGLLRTAGVSPHAAPDVLRTAFQLVWPDGPPGAEDAALLLSELGSDAHRLAGTRDALVEAALAAPADDPAVPVLAADLLRCFTTELRPAHRAPLLLLEYAGLLDGDHDVENWVDHVCGLRDGAPEPVPEPVTRRVYDALARRLLAVAAPGTEPYAPPRPPAPESELYALARAGDPGLLAAYERVARGDRVAERLRTVPGYVAACFCDWSAYPRPHGGWETTRTTLLAKVLRPVVRALPAEDQRAVEEALHRTGRGRLDAYRAWNRPGALGRLAGRLTGRGRREDRQAPWTGDVEPPAGGGRG